MYMHPIGAWVGSKRNVMDRLRTVDARDGYDVCDGLVHIS